MIGLEDSDSPWTLRGLGNGKVTIKEALQADGIGSKGREYGARATYHIGKLMPVTPNRGSGRTEGSRDSDVQVSCPGGVLRCVDDF